VVDLGQNAAGIDHSRGTGELAPLQRLRLAFGGLSRRRLAALAERPSSLVTLTTTLSGSRRLRRSTRSLRRDSPTRMTTLPLDGTTNRLRRIVMRPRRVTWPRRESLTRLRVRSKIRPLVPGVARKA
jgi:hypothetical protein